jgi:H+/Cl- antiporter ClcA
MGEPARSTAPAGIEDPGALLRSRAYRGLLVVAALLGVVVSVASWGFLELTHWLQGAVYVDLPDALGFSEVPWWWPLPVLAIAGAMIGAAIDRLPGTGGHEPSEGLATGSPTTAIELPGVLIAAVASVGLGLVLGPEAPLIAIGGGLTMFIVGRARRDVPDQATLVLVAAAAFAALATIFGSPVVGAIIIVEAAGLGGPTMPLILLPGLIAAGIGSLVFIGVGTLTGLSSSAYAMSPLGLPAYDEPRLADFAWTIVLAVVAAVVIAVVVRGGRLVAAVVARRRIALSILAAVAVGLVAVVFATISDEPATSVLFSGQDAMADVVSKSGTVSVAVLVLLLVCKAIAWAISLGGARGGPTFPAIFLGVVGGLLAGHLPGLTETPAIGVLVGAAVVAVLRLPLSAVVIALLVTQGGAAAAPLIIVGVAVAFIATSLIDARRPAGEGAPDPVG